MPEFHSRKDQTSAHSDSSDPVSERVQAQVSLPPISKEESANAQRHSDPTPFPVDVKIRNVTERTSYSIILDDGRSLEVPAAAQLNRAEVSLSKGTIELVTALPHGETYEHYLASGKPVLWMIPGWWGNARQNEAFADLLSGSYGLMTRVISPLGQCGSPFAPAANSLSAKFFGAFEDSISGTLNQFRHEPKAVLAHSTGFVWFHDACSALSPESTASIGKVLLAAPLLDIGGLPALGRFLARTGTDLLYGDSEAAVKFLGQLKFWGERTGLHHALDSARALQHVLFRDSTSFEFADAFRHDLDMARYGDYLAKMIVLSPITPLKPQWKLPLESLSLLHFSDDQNYSRTNHLRMATRFGAQFVEVEGVCHQGFAIAREREKIAEVVARKVLPIAHRVVRESTT